MKSRFASAHRPQTAGVQGAISAAVRTSQFPPSAAAAARWLTAQSSWLALVLVVELLLLFFSLLATRRKRASSLTAGTALTLALIASTLGLATYLPCTIGLRLLYAPVGWTLELFVGGVESDPSAGAACVAVQSPGFLLARTAGLLATFIGAIAASWLLARGQIDRQRMRFSSDVDAVIGLNPASLPLVKALVAENRSRPRRERWIDWHPGFLSGAQRSKRRDTPDTQGRPTIAGILLYWFTGLRKGDIGRLLTRRTKVVVVDPDGQNPLVAEARSTGAIVVNVDPSDVTFLSGLCVRRRWLGLVGKRRASLRRMFIVTASQAANVAIHGSTAQILSSGISAHRNDVVPRLFVRIDDHRNARRWLLENLNDAHGTTEGHPSHFSDALTIMDASVAAVIDQLIPAAEPSTWNVDGVVLIGDDPLAPHIFDELCWQVWCRYEVAHHAYTDFDATDSAPGNVSESLLAILQRSARPNLREVVLAGPKAAEREQEWLGLRHPWRARREARFPLSLFETVASPDEDWESAANKALTRGGAAVIFVSDQPDCRSAAARLAQRHPESIVMMRDDSTVGLEQPITAGAPYRIGSTLTGSTPGTSAPSVPADSLARLARQQHTVYAKRWPTDPAGCGRDDHASKITARDWPSLPDFFQEDNVRQHRALMHWFAQHGFRWVEATDGSRAAHELLDRKELDELIYSKYDRWRALRERRGWLSAPQVRQRHDSLRRHPDLRGKKDIDWKYNRMLTTWITDRLRAAGITVEERGR